MALELVFIDLRLKRQGAVLLRLQLGLQLLWRHSPACGQLKLECIPYHGRGVTWWTRPAAGRGAKQRELICPSLPAAGAHLKTPLLVLLEAGKAGGEFAFPLAATPAARRRLAWLGAPACFVDLGSSQELLGPGCNIERAHLAVWQS